MLATWATCCIAFGVSVALLGVDQGWVRFSTAKKSVESADKPDEIEEAKRISDSLMQTEIAKQCLEQPDEWKRIPYFWSQNSRAMKRTFVQGALYGPDKLTAEPLVFLNRDRKQFIVIAHIGNSLCGHEGIVHGGLQATLFDEITARPAFWNLPRSVALTASLKVNYRRPALANQIFVFRTSLEHMEGRKATIKATMEDLKGNVLSDAESLYVSPSNEKLVSDNSSLLKMIEGVYPGAF
ncbi:hypothetical protein DL89DRAFT_270288 [Linderina pennispora]|uniref:Thioesterase domain-containing protein n=1 Tax=Linderina pennispora TaxID=61395 RepID=A0A1Y1VZU5_9FUNG|nr:uncharacterized protein DL89DRAFT_270288 [Linderina pennispora]ORX66374.1 hypothetical protein DL89DRAFT_270288 [Linderina pennispora]